MRRQLSIACALLVACGGTDGSDLFGDAGDASSGRPDATINDAAPPLDASNDDVASPADAGSDVTTIVDASKPYQDPGVACGTGECDASAQLCCGTITSYYPTYVYSFACESVTDLVQCAGGLPIYCDDDKDCPSSQVCCGDLYQTYAKVSCKATCTGYNFQYQQVHFCDPKASDCDTGQTCKASAVLDGYYVCQ